MEDGKANLVVKLPGTLHFRVKVAAVAAERTIQAWVEEALRAKLATAQEPPA